MPLTYREVADILKIIDASDCNEVVLELEGMRLVVRRGAQGGAEVQSFSQPEAPAPKPVASQAPKKEPAKAAPKDAKAKAEDAIATRRDDGAIEVLAPMVGTFYRAPSPSDPPFVEVGAKVEAGQALCLIEVMKLFTTIEAPVAGEIVEIGVENATLVEYRQCLFAIKPRKA